MARSSKIPLLKSLIKLIFSGQLYLKDGHLAKHSHHIPDGFFGIGVAASDEPRYNDYLMLELIYAQLRITPIKSNCLSV